MKAGTARVTIVGDSGPFLVPCERQRCHRKFFGVCYGCQEYTIEVRYSRIGMGSRMRESKSIAGRQQ